MTESEQPAGTTDSAGEPTEGSPHSRRYVALRILAAVAVAGIAFAVQQLVLADEPSRETFGAKVRNKQIDSLVLDRPMDVRVVVPKGAPANDRGLVVFLHGRGDDETSYLIEPMFRALDELKTRAPVMAFPDGGDSSYWHDREGGAWASYVLDEVIPELVVRYDVDPDRIVIAGISMGGFGAYDIARLEPDRFCAVAGHSPVIWETSGETADGAFDDSDDFAANDIIEIASSPLDPYEGPRLWIDAGNDDPFLDGDDAFEQALREAGNAPIVRRSPGGHDNDYWNDNWGTYIDWYANSLRRCELDARRQAAAERGSKEDDAAGSPGSATGSRSRSKPEAPAAEPPAG